jgi:choline dehydrogenase-like flavoprotein
MRDVWEAKELKSVAIGSEYWPGKEVQTDEEVLDMVRDSLMTVWYAACTCKMGKKRDTTAVVDNLARVFGVQGLRVVDASSMALLPPGHPQSTIYAFAEKIAHDIIKQRK